MTTTRDRDRSPDERERDEAKHGRGALDPGLKEQFERDDIVVRDHPSATPNADALQRPHYEPEPPSR
jgi:hypothetical protein